MRRGRNELIDKSDARSVSSFKLQVDQTNKPALPGQRPSSVVRSPFADRLGTCGVHLFTVDEPPAPHPPAPHAVSLILVYILVRLPVCVYDIQIPAGYIHTATDISIQHSIHHPSELLILILTPILFNNLRTQHYVCIKNTYVKTYGIDTRLSPISGMKVYTCGYSTCFQPNHTKGANTAVRMYGSDKETGRPLSLSGRNMKSESVPKVRSRVTKLHHVCVPPGIGLIVIHTACTCRKIVKNMSEYTASCPCGLIMLVGGCAAAAVLLSLAMKYARYVIPSLCDLGGCAFMLRSRASGPRTIEFDGSI